MTSYSDPLWWGVPIPFQEDFNPIGTAIRVESNHEAVVQAARESFGRYERSNPPEQPQFLLRVCVDPVDRANPPWPKPSFRSLGHLVHIACGDRNFAVADVNTRTGFGFVTEAMAKDSSFFRSTFLDCLFYVLAVHHLYTPVHCSGVVSDGKGVLICGLSGVGKSTLAYACLRSGLQVLCDDVMHLRIDPASDQLLLWGRPWILRLQPEAAELFPELKGQQPRLRSDHEWYLEIDVESQFPGGTAISCQPEALVFLDRQTDTTTRLDPLDAPTALTRLQKDIFLSETAVLERHRRTLEKLLQTKAYTLSYAGTPANAVEVVLSILRARSS